MNISSSQAEYIKHSEALRIDAIVDRPLYIVSN